MKKKVSILLVLTLVAAMCMSFVTVEASNSAGKWQSGDEYLSVGKSEFEYGEAVAVSFKLDEAEAKRMCVVYKDVNANGTIDDGDHPYWYQGATGATAMSLICPYDGGGGCNRIGISCLYVDKML